MPDYPLDVSIIITTFNQLRFTVQCFASLAQTVRGISYEIIVVDNGSTDGTQAWVMSNTSGVTRGRAAGKYPPKRITLLHNTKPRALALSWNMGVDAAIGRHVMICNNDIMFARDAVARMVEVADNNPLVGALLPMCPMDLSHTEFIQIKAPDLRHPYKEKNWVDTAASNVETMKNWPGIDQLPNDMRYYDESYLEQGGFTFLLTRRAWERVGRFDEGYEFTCEDWDYFHRLRRYYRLARRNDAFVFHFEHQTMFSQVTKPEQLERFALNRFLLTERREGNYEYFSIILPTYKRLQTLCAAIDSVLAQSFPHWRLYVIDDGSPNWKEICDVLWLKYHEQFARIGLFPRPTNLGPGATRNYGLSICRGKYVAFLDSDDEWYPDHLSTHWRKQEQRDFVMAYSNPDFAWKDWIPQSKTFRITPGQHPTIVYFDDYDKIKLCARNYIQTSSVTIWGDLARRFRFPEDLKICEDWEYFKAVADSGGAGRNVTHIDRATCRYNFVRGLEEEPNIVRVFVPKFDTLAPAMPTGIDIAALAGIPTEHSILAMGLPTPGPVSVIIPTHDRPDALRRALRSCGPVEVIVVDDHSANADANFAVVREFENTTLFRFAPGRGASAARNLAAAHTTGEWLQFLDDDDVLVPGWQAMVTGHEGFDVVIGKAYVPAAAGFSVSDEVFTSQLCVRKSAFLGVGGFNEMLFWAEERDLLARLTDAGARILRLDVASVMRPQRGGSGRPETAIAPPRRDPAIRVHGRLARGVNIR